MTKAAIHGLDRKILFTSALLSGPCPIGLSPLRSLSNNLRGVSFNNDAELQNWLDEFFTAKTADFFKRGFGNLPEC
jgi:hypothetical protein